MARAGSGGSRGGGGGRSFGGRAGGAGGGSFKRGGVSGGPGGGFGSPGGSRGSAPRPGAGGPRPGGAGGYGGFGGPGMYPGGMGPRPGGPPPPPPPGYGYNNYGGFGRRRRGGYYPGYYGRGGCFTMLAMALTAVVLGVLLMGAASPANAAPTTRQKLPESAVNKTAYYSDGLGWIDNSTLLLEGMEHFYSKTGVQPYLYLTPDINGSENPTGAEAQQYANALYNQLFTDEGHYLLIFAENPTGYYTWYLAGEDAARVMDTDASNTLLDYIDDYYYSSNLSDEQMFSRAFEKTADKIMRFTLPWWGIALLVVGIGVIVVAVTLSRRDRQQRRAAEVSAQQWREE